MIDAHSHLPADHPDALAMLESLGLRVTNICVDSHELGGLDSQRAWYRRLITDHPQRFAWCTSFSLEGFGSADWPERVIEQLRADFAAGAIAAKVWKNVGMDLRDPATREYVFVDDPRFDPVFRFLEQSGRPLMMHIGEPMACWSALDPESPHYPYYAANPQWHWHNRTDVPTHARLIASRDAIAERYPGLTVIGAHFGSLEYDLSELARRLDRYPNLMADTSARLGDVALLARKDHAATRAFFIRYADRILWGKDWVFTRPFSQMPEEERTRAVGYVRRGYEQERRFYTGADVLQVDRKDVQGLGLPADVIDRLFEGNARRVYGL